MRRGVVLGIIAGTIMGFVDSYGYAITGYTTAELALLIAPALVILLAHIIYRTDLSIEELVIGISIAVGFSLSTTITSGMFITFGFLDYWSKEMGIKVTIPSWIYGHEYIHAFGINIPEYFLPYLFLTSVSASGFLIAYVMRNHFIEKERLPYPIGTASAIIIRLLKFSNPKFYLVPLIAGFTIQLLLMIFGMPFVDLTPTIADAIPGMSFGVRADLVVFLLALLMPLGACTGIALGNALTYLLLLPILLALGMLVLPLSPTMDDVISASAPVVASIITGYVVMIASIYIMRNWRVYHESLSLVLKFRGERLFLFLSFTPLVVATALSYTMIPELISQRLVWLPPLMLLLIHPLLSILNMRACGEAGIASQALLPSATALMYTVGARGAAVYAYLDPFTGITMPQVIAGVAGNISKMSRILGIPILRTLMSAMFGFLVGAPLTLCYGILLANAYGFNSPKMPLDRWIPIVTWMSALYSGEVLRVFSLEAMIAGALLALSVLGLKKYCGLGVAVFAVLVGITLTPDTLVLFLIAAILKYLSLRIGLGIYERLIAMSGIALVGAGLAIIVYTLVISVVMS